MRCVLSAEAGGAGAGACGAGRGGAASLDDGGTDGMACRTGCGCSACGSLRMGMGADGGWGAGSTGAPCVKIARTFPHSTQVAVPIGA